MKPFITFLILLFNSFFSSAQNSLTNYTIPVANLPGGITNENKFTLDSSGNVLMCSEGSGLILFDGTNYSNFLISNSGIASNNTIAVSVSKGKYYIATKDSGLSVYNGTNWTNYSTTNSGLINNKLISIYALGDSIYMGSKNGFSLFYNGIFTNYSRISSGLQCDTINDFLLDNQGILWLATDNGVINFDGFSFESLAFQTAMPFQYRAVKYFYYEQNVIWFTSQGLTEPAIFKIVNGKIVDALSNMSSGWGTNGLLGSYLLKGPQGGILSQTGIPGYKFFTEFYNNKLYTYLLTNGTGLDADNFLVYDKNRDLIWLKGYSNSFCSIPMDSIQIPSQNLPENCVNLSVNQVKAAILNRGDMFWNLERARYEVPKGSGKNAHFTSALWIGGLDSASNLHLAAQTYRQHGNDYWPGPLDTITGSTDSTVMQNYDKIWNISKYDVEQFKYYFQQGQVQNGNFIPAYDILTWPAQGQGNYSRNLAPYVDVNNDGVYNPLIGGDYPMIKGDQMLYWIFNDNLWLHYVSDTLPMKIEVHASAYAYSCPALQTRDSIINYTTFYNYKIFNRSDLNYDSCFIANWSHFELGNPSDDATGSNPSNNFVYVYNNDSVDETNGVIAYGVNPPIMSNVILNGPDAISNDGIDNDNDGTIDEINEKDLLTNALIYAKSFNPFEGNPSKGTHYYNYLQAKWRNGSPLTYGGSGYLGSTVTKHMYPDFPSNSNGWYQPSAYTTHIVASSGPFNFQSGSSFDYDFAFVFSRDTTQIYNSSSYYNMAVTDVQKVKSWFVNNNAPSCAVFPGIKELKKNASKLNVFPNPAEKLVQISLSENMEIIAYALIDGVGKLLFSKDLELGNKTINIEISYLMPGYYILVVKTKSGETRSAKFLKQ